MKLPRTNPIENVVDIRQWSDAYMKFSRSLPWPRDLIEIHKTKLGKQNGTGIFGFKRKWVWNRGIWIVFINNSVGIDFEVPEGTTEAGAWTAWVNYVQSMEMP